MLGLGLGQSLLTGLQRQVMHPFRSAIQSYQDDWNNLQQASEQKFLKPLNLSTNFLFLYIIFSLSFVSPITRFQPNSSWMKVIESKIVPYSQNPSRRKDLDPQDQLKTCRVFLPIERERVIPEPICLRLRHLEAHLNQTDPLEFSKLRMKLAAMDMQSLQTCTQCNLEAKRCPLPMARLVTGCLVSASIVYIFFKTMFLVVMLRWQSYMHPSWKPMIVTSYRFFQFQFLMVMGCTLIQVIY